MPDIFRGSSLLSQKIELDVPAQFATHHWKWQMLRGGLALLLAIATFLFPTGAVWSFALVFALYAGADGIISLIAGLAAAVDKEERWGALILRGMLGVAAALLFLLLPGLATLGGALVIELLLASWAMVAGLLELWAAVRLRRLIPNEWMLGLSGAASLVLGILLWMMVLTYPSMALVTVGWMIAVWAAVSGAALIMLAIRLRHAPTRLRNGGRFHT